MLMVSVAVSAQAKKTVKKAPPAILSGKITFQKLFNPVKVEPNAYVMAHKSDAEYDSPQDTIATFRKATMSRYLYKTTKDEYYLKQLKIYNADSPLKYDALAEIAARHYYKVKSYPETITSFTDSQGNYKLSLPPGRYEIIFKSNEIMNDNKLEIDGIVTAYFIEVKSGEHKELDYNFR